MKNRRNTRRGRAKRWYGMQFADGTIHYVLRMSSGFISMSPNGRTDAYVLRGCRYHAVQMPSRAAAMRAAEHLARRR